MFWLLSFGVFFHIAFLPLSAFFVSILAIDAYKMNEPVEMVQYSKHFIHAKISAALQVVVTPYAVPLILANIFQSQYIWLIIYVFIYLITTILLPICYKYAHYNPLRAKGLRTTILDIMVLLAILPGGLLITICYTVWQYHRANKHMQQLFV